ncbi:winged helix-turn-helix transcriptional regulator [Candidatus Woesearchaeota archaeon]|nr:winged helix-turn-helix transcriptional regulator [Candidatus Woesearchaeota archaeon]
MKDKKIIELMRTGKRLNISEIARQLGKPVSTVNDAIKRIEKKYVLKRSSLLDYNKLGYHANAMVVVKIKQGKQDFLEYLKELRFVNSIYHIDSGYDFLIDVVFKDVMGLKFWIEEIKKHFSLEVLVFHVRGIEEVERWVP